ncbi:hypothetical protein SOPP22_09760 [Shewanella sp. OPT22]|nr:hypothetical protein SOPP22_09760 [Shewanella sp. OPT22]
MLPLTLDPGARLKYIETDPSVLIRVDSEKEGGCFEYKEQNGRKYILVYVFKDELSTIEAWHKSTDATKAAATITSKKGEQDQSEKVGTSISSLKKMKIQFTSKTNTLNKEVNAILTFFTAHHAYEVIEGIKHQLKDSGTEVKSKRQEITPKIVIETGITRK